MLLPTRPYFIKWGGIILAALLLILALPAAAQGPDDYWPTGDWRTTSPEAQGMDSAPLIAMMQSAVDAHSEIDSLLVIRNGYVVLEAYRPPYNQDRRHHIFSCTKSFISTLIGIAIDRGEIAGVDLSIADLLPADAVAGLDEAKQAITLDNLLTMSSGLDWEGGMFETSINQMTARNNWVQYVLDQPLVTTPGDTFVYHSGGSHLLSVILTEATGLSASAYAEEHLFGPLGITTYEWRADPQDYNTGGWGLYLRPRDMAKLGYLYLHNGQWDGAQIVSAGWVTTATQEHIRAGGTWLSSGYGYQWWIDDEGYIMALGWAGQYIVVIPAVNMVVVFTSSLPASQFFLPEDMLNEYIIPAAVSTGPLPENPDAAADLAAVVKSFESGDN